MLILIEPKEGLFFVLKELSHFLNSCEWDKSCRASKGRL